jgi:hypothetical protein
MTDTPSALADRTLREWAQAAEENPVLKARIRVLEGALLKIAKEMFIDGTPTKAARMAMAALQPPKAGS